MSRPEPSAILLTQIAARRGPERKRWVFCLAISAALHVSVFVLWRELELQPPPSAAAGPQASDSRAARGSMQAVTMRAMSPVPVLRPFIPKPVVEITLDPVLDEPFVLEPPPDPGEGEGGDLDRGLEDGTGGGDGGTGDANRCLITNARSVFLLPPHDGKLKGSELTAHIWVTTEGRVDPDSTRLSPPTPDEGFNRQVLESLAQMLFEPRVCDGAAIAFWHNLTYRIGSSS